jgi:hypothetical protein
MRYLGFRRDKIVKPGEYRQKRPVVGVLLLVGSLISFLGGGAGFSQLSARFLTSGCEQAPLRGQQPESLRLCWRIATITH